MIRTTWIKLLLLISVLISSISFISPQAMAQKPKQVDVKISTGYENNYKIGFPTPVNFTIKSLTKDIKGEVEVQVQNTPGKYISYVKPLNLQKGAEKVITINVPINNNIVKYKVNIYNGNENIYKNSISIRSASNNITYFIGILSDDFEALSYINKVSTFHSGLAYLTKTIKLDEKNFPQDLSTLNSFNILVINDFDTSKLSKEQYENIKQWVLGGGTLLVGTGSKYRKTLAVFKDNFVLGSQGNIKEVLTDKIYNLATNGDSNKIVKVDILNLDVKNSKTILAEKDDKLAQKLEKGKGTVCVLGFDLAQAPFTNWSNNSAFTEKLFAKINPTIMSSNNNFDYKRNMGYNLRNSLTQFSEMVVADTNIFYILIFIYIFLVAPVSYFILKKIDRRELMWLVVPSLAILFTLIVNFTGSSSRLSEITTNIVSYVDFDEHGNNSMDTYVGIFNSNKQDLKVSGENGERFEPFALDYYYQNPNQINPKEIMEAKIHQNSGEIEYKNSSLLETKALQVYEKNINIGNIEAHIFYENSGFSGTIVNKTSLELVDCFIITNKKYYRIGNIKPNETFKLINSQLKNNNGNFNQIFEKEFFSYNYNYSPQGLNEKDRKKQLDRQLEGNIMQAKYNNNIIQTGAVRFIAFSKTPIHKGFIVNGNRAKKNERIFIDLPTKIAFVKGKNISYPDGFIPYEIVNQNGVNYNQYNNSFAGNGTVEMLFELDKNMIVNEIKISTANGAFIKQTSTINPTVKYSILNLKTNKFESIKLTALVKNYLKKYLSKENSFTIKMEVKDIEGMIPDISASGRLK